MLAHESLLHLKSHTGFQPIGDPVGNLTLGRGQLQGKPVHVAIVEARIASGSLGAKESDKLASLFKVVAAMKDHVLAEAQVMLITNAAQFDHMMQLAQQEGQTDPFKDACRRVVVASIGPTASERIRSHGLSVDFEPSHGKMGILVKETSEQAQHLFAAKHIA